VQEKQVSLQDLGYSFGHRDILRYLKQQ